MNIASITGIALSGMNAQTNRLAAVADNIANADTARYQPLSAKFSSSPAGGVTTDVTTSGDAPVDPTTDMVDMIDAEMSFRANLSAFETGADLWDALLAMKKD